MNIEAGRQLYQEFHQVTSLPLLSNLVASLKLYCNTLIIISYQKKIKTPIKALFLQIKKLVSMKY